MKITLSSNGLVAIRLINKLFSLGFVPEDIEVWCSEIHQPLNAFCKTYDIKWRQIVTASDFFGSNHGDLLLSMFGSPLLVPDTVINQFKFGGINFHPADTEKYRGRWMVSWCLINNESTVSYTWHRMNSQYDTGNILVKHTFEILEKDTAFSLNLRLSEHAISNLETILSMKDILGKPPGTIGTYYNKSVPFDGMIDPDWTLDRIDRFIRAMYHPPHLPAKLIKNGKIHYIKTIDCYKETLV